MRSLCLAWLLLLLLPSAMRADVAIQFDPKEPMLDDVVTIRVTGLSPGATVTVRARSNMYGKTWQGVATFKADEQGVVDVAKHRSLKGTYTGVEPMGLFWSMEPQKEPPKPVPFKITDPNLTAFEVETDGTSVAKAELKRWLLRPGVRVTSVKENGLVGRLFEPEGTERRPGILVLTGSEGGINEVDAALLASQGYVTLALAYFRAEGLPQQLAGIRLEYLKQGIDWLAARPTVDGKRLGVEGASKGGELALLLASQYPELKAVVARVPSHVVWFDLGTFRQSSWKRDGKDLPFVPMPKAAGLATGTPARLVNIYRPALDDKDAVEKARIPVENSKGAMLLISGTDDQMWPSALMADEVVARLKAKKYAHPYQHLKYDGAGHGIPSGFVPIRQFLGNSQFAMGGSVEASARASTESRPIVLRFWKENLKVP